MFASRLRAASLAVVSTLALSACASPYGGVGVGYGNGGYYGGYGSYGSYGGYDYGRYGYDPYYSGYYGRSPAYNPYGGWYSGFYYPGSGYYVYSRDGRRHRWSDAQRRYWENHRRDRDNKPSVGDVLSRPFEDRVRREESTSTTATAPARVERRVRTERPTVRRESSDGGETTRERSSTRKGMRVTRKDQDRD